MHSYTALQPGDEIRVIAPSTSSSKKRMASYNRAQTFLEAAGYTVSFGKNIMLTERFGTGPVMARLDDFHEAYQDKNVKVIMALHGGWAANALLSGIDWELVRANPKPLIGFSDITVLVNALYAMTGRIQYLGPNFSSLGHAQGGAYSRNHLLKILTGDEALELSRSRQWERQRGEPLSRTRPWLTVQAGQAQGTLIGGNIGTFYLLQGTPYQPVFDGPVILAVEDDDEAGGFSAREFDRRLESLLQLPGLRQNLAGLLVGRFQPASRVSLPDTAYILKRMNLPVIPIVADMDFGHTWPMLTLPIGGTVSIDTQNHQAQLKLLKY